MEHRSALTLKPGDVLDIPGVGVREITAISQAKDDRYLIRISMKFEPDVSIVVSTRTSEPRTPEQSAERQD